MNTRILKRANLAAIVAATTAVLFATSAMAASFQVLVTTLDDVSDFSGFQQVSDLPGPDGRVSFREAVAAANNTAGPQTIAFAIPPAEFWLVPDVGLLRLEQGAFFLNDSGTTVDFSTQTANMGDTNPNGPEIGIYGLEPNGWGIAAIFVNGDNCVVKGLGNVYLRGYAVQIVGDNNRVIGCQIDGPLHAAVSVSGYMGWPAPSGNIVGGTAPGEGNILIGLVINGPAEGNIVIGNTLLVGVGVQGATQYGVIARNNRIGGPTPAEGNVISGAGHYGEEGFPVGEQVSIVDADGTIVEGNYIGTTADGLHRYPQQIGPIGVEVRDSRGTTIRANLIAGLRVVGTDHYAGQVFGEAIHVGAVNANTDGTVIQGNTIGLAADGVTPIVTRSGINVSPFSSFYHAFGTRIASNHIASVETTGVFVAALENGVTITGNSIHDCGALGIDLGTAAGADGPTPNDPGDGDTGGNRLQNFPVLLSAATTGSAVMVQGTLDSSPSAQFTVEFFVSPSCDPSGFGEGAAFIGSTTVTTDGAGHATFSLTLPAAVAVGARATATATRLSTGDTSEFSACVAVTSAGLPVANASATPTSGSAPLTVQFSSAGSSDPGGTITSYSWNFGDGGNSTAANPSHTYTSAGTYTATLTVYDSRGATGTTSLTIRVAGANQPPVAKTSATPTSGTAPLAVNFSSAGSSDPDGTIASYSWNFGDGTTSAATNPSHTYTSAGTYTAKLTVTDNAGSTASASVTITVTASTAKTLRSTAINLSGTRSGSRVTVSGQVVVRDAANAAVSGVNVKVTWRKPDGTTVTQTGTTSSSGTASFNTSGGRGTYTLTVNNLTKTGYMFDKVNSVLSKSITK